MQIQAVSKMTGQPLSCPILLEECHSQHFDSTVKKGFVFFCTCTTVKNIKVHNKYSLFISNAYLVLVKVFSNLKFYAI